MTDFTTNIDMNVRMMNEKLRVDRNIDILQRDVLIGGKRTHFYFIDGFVQEETIEKLVQFFYSLKESDIKDIDTFLEGSLPVLPYNLMFFQVGMQDPFFRDPLQDNLDLFFFINGEIVLALVHRSRARDENIIRSFRPYIKANLWAREKMESPKQIKFSVNRNI